MFFVLKGGSLGGPPHEERTRGTKERSDKHQWAKMEGGNWAEAKVFFLAMAPLFLLPDGTKMFFHVPVFYRGAGVPPTVEKRACSNKNLSPELG